jgi:hypothetical protein
MLGADLVCQAMCLRDSFLSLRQRAALREQVERTDLL